MKQTKIDRIIKELMEQEGMTTRKIKNRMAKAIKQEDEEKNQKQVKQIDINIEWKKSRTWGNCPKATAEVFFTDGTHDRFIATASGCGYDKESTVIADVFNEYLKYTLWAKEEQDNKDKPYGVCLSYDYSPYFQGGVGTDCYYAIAEFIGGKFERVASGLTFDVYRLTM